MITAVGTGIGTGDGEGAFNLERLRYHKIVIMTDADVDGSHIRTLLLTFFFRQMPELVKRGHIYIAQPPLYQILRKRRVEYVEDDAQLNRILIQLGAEEVSLKNLSDERVFNDKQLDEILELLTSLDRYANALRRQGGDFSDYVEKINPRTQELPKHFVRVRDGNDEFAHYFHTEKELFEFSENNPDLGLYENEEDENGNGENENGNGNGNNAKNGKTKGLRTRRATHVELYERSAVSDLLKKLARRGLSIEHYSAQDKPLFELSEGEGIRAKTRKLFSIPEILEAVKEVGRHGIQIKRFKGLGEMNAKELFETTMNPLNRKFLRVEVPDVVEAEEMFTKLMGEEVEPRRQFIQDNALNVRNLDV